MKLLKIIILIIIVVILNSCFWNAPGDFSYRFNGKMTGIDSVINVDGYYRTDNCDSPLGYFLFYRDGSFASGFWIKSNQNSLLNIDSLSDIHGWGIYKIIKDTIKTQSIVVYGNIMCDNFTMARVDVYERWFKIINTETIEEIKFLDIKDKNLPYPWEYLNKKSYFTPLANRPDSSCWLKTQNWAWEDGVAK